MLSYIDLDMNKEVPTIKEVTSSGYQGPYRRPLVEKQKMSPHIPNWIKVRFIDE